MTDTLRTLSALQTLLADNTSGLISAQDVRDMLVSLAPDRGEMYVSSSAVTTTAVQNTWYAAAGTWAATTSPALRNFDMNSNGQLRYTGTSTRVFHVVGTLSVTSAGNSKTYEFGVNVNGTINTPSIVRRKIGTGADVGAVAVQAYVELATNQYVGLMVRNITDTTNVTIDLATLVALGVIE